MTTIDIIQWAVILFLVLLVFMLTRSDAQHRRQLRNLESCEDYHGKAQSELRTILWELRSQVNDLEMKLANEVETHKHHRGHVSTIAGKVRALGDYMNLAWVEDKNEPAHWTPT